MVNRDARNDNAIKTYHMFYAMWKDVRMGCQCEYKEMTNLPDTVGTTTESLSRYSEIICCK
jgi:hypothetical protein